MTERAADVYKRQVDVEFYMRLLQKNPRFVVSKEPLVSIGVSENQLTESLSLIHILFGGICDLDYYHRAIAEIRKRKPDVKFFLFSNDMEWTKEHFCGSEFVPVEGNSEQAGEQDLYLMSCCKNHILANSSFSWWGAWLDKDVYKRQILQKV